jgi:hypothetical protein
MASAKEFVDFWLENSVHPDEQISLRRGREAVQRLADNLVRAAEEQGFSKAQIEAEIGDLYTFIRASSGSLVDMLGDVRRRSDRQAPQAFSLLLSDAERTDGGRCLPGTVEDRDTPVTQETVAAQRHNPVAGRRVKPSTYSFQATLLIRIGILGRPASDKKEGHKA